MLSHDSFHVSRSAVKSSCLGTDVIDLDCEREHITRNHFQQKARHHGDILLMTERAHTAVHSPDGNSAAGEMAGRPALSPAVWPAALRPSGEWAGFRHNPWKM